MHNSKIFPVKEKMGLSNIYSCHCGQPPFVPASSPAQAPPPPRTLAIICFPPKAIADRITWLSFVTSGDHCQTSSMSESWDVRQVQAAATHWVNREAARVAAQLVARVQLLHCNTCETARPHHEFRRAQMPRIAAYLCFCAKYAMRNKSSQNNAHCDRQQSALVRPSSTFSTCSVPSWQKSAVLSPRYGPPENSSLASGASRRMPLQEACHYSVVRSLIWKILLLHFVEVARKSCVQCAAALMHCHSKVPGLLKAEFVACIT